MNLTSKYIVISCLSSFLILIFSASTISAGSFIDQFKDPKDGAFDASAWLLDRKGFLPVPTFVSDPAVGYGGGLALLFFHGTPEDKDADERQDDGESLPPSVSAVAGAYTENGSWMLGGGHLGSWKNDSVRYTGAIAGASLNLKFYGIDSNNDLGLGPLEFKLEGIYLFQEVRFRIRDSKFFIGGRYTYMNADNVFEIQSVIPGIPDVQIESNDAGLGLVASYDSRDNIFTPNRGHLIELLAVRFDDALGGDFDYSYLKASSHSWWALSSNVVLGVRLDGQFTEGDTPFYSLPFIDLRGIPAMRYQGENVFVAELEPRWDITYRWSLVGFMGSGWTADSISNFSDSSAEVTGGVGFRYLAARRLNMRVGLDIARGPEETVVYMQVGSAW